MAEENHTQMLLQQQQQSTSQQQQMQQPQIQQQQMQQPQQLQQQTQQQAVAVTMSLGSTVEQNNQMNVSTSVPINVATINVSQAQQMQTIPQNVNTSSGTPVQMAVPQLTPQAQTVQTGNMISQSSGPHPTMIHPTMTMAQSPLQHVQVIQQPLSTPYLQHVYTPQQQMVFPGNLTLQHASMTTPALQSISATQGLSLQLQAKPAIDPKNAAGGQTLQAVNPANKNIVNAGTMMTASGQVIGTATQKANFPQQMMAAPGKSTIIHSQSGFAPSNPNQIVIGPVGVLPNQQPIFNHKALADTQKGKTYAFHNQTQTLQPKSLYSSSVPVHSSAQVFNGSHIKQISASQPQIITTQAPGTMFSQAQIFGSFAPLPQGISWATPGNFQSSTLLTQNPIILRSQQSDMLFQSPPQTAMHLPVAAATAPVPATTFAATPMAPQKHKQVRVRPGTQTVAVATQTMVSNAVTVNSNTPPMRAQIRPKGKIAVQPYQNASVPAPAQPQMATTQTQTNQSLSQTQPQPQPQPQPLPSQPKSDAANQTLPNQAKSATTPETKLSHSKSVGVEAKQLPPQLPVKSQAMVAPSTKVVHTTVSPTIGVSVAITVTSAAVTTTTTVSSSPVVTSSVVQGKATVVPVMTSTETSTSPSPPPPPPPNLPETVDVITESEIVDPVSVPKMPKETVVCEQPADTKSVVESEPVVPQPITKPVPPVKEKQPQKAIVKPQVLTHVIDGFVIQEGPEPFPVSRSSLLSDSSYRVMPPEKPKRPEEFQAASPKKKLKIHSSRGPGRKRKVGFRGRKGQRKQSSNQILENSIQEVEESISPAEEPVLDAKIIEETPVTVPETVPVETPIMEKVEEVEVVKTESDLTQKLPTKWSVQEVFEFIRDLPGCSDYADVFRSQEIDGQALLLLKEDHLMTAMCMKLGPAVKLISHINSIKEKLSLHT